MVTQEKLTPIQQQFADFLEGELESPTPAETGADPIADAFRTDTEVTTTATETTPRGVTTTATRTQEPQERQTRNADAELLGLKAPERPERTGLVQDLFREGTFARAGEKTAEFLGRATGLGAVGRLAGETIKEGIEVGKDIGEFAETGEVREREVLGGAEALTKGASGAAQFALLGAGATARGATQLGRAALTGAAVQAPLFGAESVFADIAAGETTEEIQSNFFRSFALGAVAGAAIPIGGRIISGLVKSVKTPGLRKQVREIAVKAQRGEDLTDTEAQIIKNAAEVRSGEITKSISPVLDKAEKRRAIAESRVREPATRIGRIIKSAEVLPSNEVEKASRVVQEYIPDLSTRPARSIGQIQEALGNIEKPLSERLKLTRFNINDIEGMKSGTERIYEELAEEGLFSAKKSVLKSGRAQMEKIQMKLEKIPEMDRTADRLRELRGEIDTLTNKRVKDATREQLAANSTLAAQNEIWHINRNIVNDAVAKTAERSGDDLTKKLTSDMSSLLRAQQNIVESADISQSFFRRNKNAILGTALTLTTGGTLFGIFGR